MTNHTIHRAWWSTQHDHSRCWWNWETGHWICSAAATAAAAIADLSTPTLQERR